LTGGSQSEKVEGSAEAKGAVNGEGQGLHRVIAIPITVEVFDNPKRCGNTWSTRQRASHPKGWLTTACVEVKARDMDSMLNTLLHELGHALGLHHHLPDPSEMMTKHDGGFRDGEVVIGTVTSRALKWLYNPDIPAACCAEGLPVVCSQCYHEGWLHQRLVKTIKTGVYSAHSNYLRAGRQARPGKEAREAAERIRPVSTNEGVSKSKEKSAQRPSVTQLPPSSAPSQPARTQLPSMQLSAGAKSPQSATAEGQCDRATTARRGCGLGSAGLPPLKTAPNVGVSVLEDFVG